jgi:S-adenosylmethionine synthetase
MPAPIMFAHRLGRELTRIRKAGEVKWLRPDAKSQVSVQYENGKPVRITNVVISTQHAADAKHKTIQDFCIEEVIKKVLPKNLCNREKSLKRVARKVGKGNAATLFPARPVSCAASAAHLQEPCSSSVIAVAAARSRW